MKFDEFKNIVLAIKEAYPNANIMKTEEGVMVWYEMLKDLEYRSVSEAVKTHIRTNRFAPAVADVRKLCMENKYYLWSVEWARLLDGARSCELNEPAQYALKTITRGHISYCRDNPAKIITCMKEFERLYREYMTIREQDLVKLRELEVIQTPIAAIPMKEESAEDDDWNEDEWWKYEYDPEKDTGG